MSNNDDDLDNDLDLDLDEMEGGGFDDFSSKGTLGDLWRNNPMVKVGVILAAFVVIVGGVILFGGKAEDLPVSRMGSGNDLTEAPGTSEVSESYRQAVEQVNTETAEQALRDNSSAVPMPVEPPKGTIGLQVDEEEAEDPLDRWRRMQEERIQQQQIVNQQPTVPPPEAPPVDTKTPAVNAMAKAMSMQMESVLANQQIKAPHFQHITSMDYLEAIQAKEQQAREDALAKQQALMGGAAADGKIQNIIIPAGTIEYAQLITEANTDAPGPVMAQIASGPLAGSRLIGTFSATDEYLTLNFNTVVIDGVSEAANAVAIDPNTTLPGMVTEIDHRYLKRIILPAAAAFVEGLGEAIADSGQTTIYVQGDNAVQSSGNKDNREEVATGFKEAGEKFSDLLEEEADATRPMLRIAAGTPIGVMFITPVIEGDDLEEQNQRENARLIQLQQFQSLQQPFIPSFPTLPGLGTTATGTTTTGTTAQGTGAQ